MCATVQSEISKRKAVLYAAVSDVDMGRAVLDDDIARKEIDELVASLEAVNPTKLPTDSALCGGRWRLAYTDSKGTLGPTRPRSFHAEEIWQKVNMEDESFENGETGTFRIFGKPVFRWRNLIYGKCRGVRGTRLRLKFERFLVGGFLSVKFPGPAVGWQEQTYLDEDTRVCRTHLGSIVVMQREGDVPRV